MMNEELWKPSKFQFKNGNLRISRDRKELGLASRLSASQVLQCYNRHLADHCRGRLLDLGCGKVPFYAAYRALVDEVYCVDWEHSAHGVTHVDQHADLTEPLPLDDASFDTIILSSVMEHIPTPWLLWGEMNRVLRPGGKALLNAPFLYWVHEAPHDFYRYTEFALRRMAEEAGLKTLVLESTGGAPVVLADLISKSLRGIPVVSSVAARCTQGCAWLLLKSRVGARFNERTSAAISNGYFMVAQKQ